MFAKYWEPGQVKTRLAASVGNEMAAAMHQTFVETLLTRLANRTDQRALHFTPDSAQAAFRDAAPSSWELVPQVAGDLGQRMQQFFEQSLANHNRVVLIGSDSPDLPTEHLDLAFDSLRTVDVVLGPASDGGYYLVGVARRVPPIFVGIDWSTSAVWRQTTERLASAGVSFHVLPPWDDVDDQQGLRDLIGRLQLRRCLEPELKNLCQRLTGLLSDRDSV